MYGAKAMSIGLSSFKNRSLPSGTPCTGLDQIYFSACCITDHCHRHTLELIQNLVQPNSYENLVYLIGEMIL